MNICVHPPIIRLRRSSYCGAMVFSILAMALAGCTTGPQAQPAPHATSSLDASQQRLACLQEKGWDVELGSDDSVQGAIPAQQMDAFQRDNEVCGRGLIPDKSTFTQEQWSASYAMATETADCLENLGYEVTDRPTLQAYVDILGEWNPYISLLDAGVIAPPQMPSLERSCPQPDYWG